MNMISTTSFELDDRVKEKQNELVKKFARIWEQKNAKSAKAGGASLMALSLAACGSGSNEAEAPVDLSGAGTTTTHVIQRTETETTLIWDGQFTDEVQFSGGDLASLFDNNALVADWVAPILTTDTTNAGVVFTGRTTSAADDQIYGDGYAVHGAVIDGGLGNDTLYIDMKSPFAQPLAVVNVENVEIVNVQNIYADDAQEISALEDPDPRYVADSVNSEVDLFKVIDMTSLTISEGANAAGTLDVWNVKGGTSLTFEGNFENNVRVDYMDSMASVNMTMSNVSTEALIDVSHNAKTVNLTSTGGGVNDIDGTVFGNANQHLRTLNISGDTELNVGFDSGTAVTFDGDRTATINASSLAADLQIGVGAHTDVNYTGTDRTSGIDYLMVSAADDSGEDRMTLNADFGAGGSGVNTLVYNAQAAGTDYLKAGSTISSDAADGVTLAITGNAAGILNATALANVDAIGNVVFNTDTSLQMTAAQVSAIGIGNFSTYDSVDQDGQLIISNVTSTTDLNLSSMDNGSLVSVRTADASDVTLTATTVLGNLNSGVTQAEIYAESGNSTLTMTADQFQQLDGTGTVVLRGIENDANTGNNPATNTAYTGGLVITDVAENEVINLNAVQVSTVGINIGTAGATFTAAATMQITDPANNEAVTLNVSGTTDLTSATLTNVDSVVLVGGATLTATAAQLAALDISGQGTINVVGDLTLNTTNNTYDMDEIGLVFVEAAAGTNQTLTVAGASSLVIESLGTTANITRLDVDNTLGAGQTFTITGASPAISLHADTVRLDIGADDGNFTVMGTESDDAATAAVEPSITGSGLVDLNIAGGNAASTIALGAISGVGNTLNIADAVTTRTTKTSVQLDNIPSDADWTLDAVGLTVNTGATVGAGSSLTLLNNTTIADGSVGLDSLPISADSTLVVTSTYTAAEITSTLDALSGATAAVNVTGMSAEQLKAVAAADNKVGSAEGTLIVTNSLTAAEIGTIVGLADFDDPATSNQGYAVITGMTAAQLNALGGNWTDDGISGTATLTDDVTAAAIGVVLGDSIRSATINIDATDMTEGAGSQLRAVRTDIGAVDAITNLTLTSASDQTDIEALATRSSDVTINAAAMSNAQLQEVADVIEKVGTINNLTLTQTESPALMTTLLSSAATTAATVNATNMDADDKDVVVANIASVTSVTNYTATSADTVAELTALLGKATGAAVTLTGMTSAQTDVVVANVANITSYAGETTAAVITALDAAISTQLDATGVTAISGTVAELTTVAATQVGVGAAATDNSVQTVDLKADFTVSLTDAAGTALTSTAIDVVGQETTGTVTLANAVNVSGTLANLRTMFVEANGANPEFEAGDADGTIGATANMSITDAADTAMTAVNLSNLGLTTSGTVTVANAAAISGSETEMTAALVTAASKVVAATSNLTITGVDNISTESEQQVIEDIDAATSGTIDVQLDNSGVTANFTNYEGGALTITGGTAGDTITGTANADTIKGGAGDDTMAGGAGNDTYLVVNSGDTDDIVELSGGGTDTITTAGAGGTIDFSSTKAGGTALAAFSQIEQLIIDAGQTATFTGAQLTGLSMNINEDDTGTTTLDINVASGETADFSNLTFTAGGGQAFDDGTDVIDIDGAGGAETITGTSIADNIDGGGGADTIIGGAGNDTLAGGAGADKFKFSDTNGTDTITFVKADDDLDFTGVTANGTLAKAAITNDAGATLGELTLTANTTVYVVDTDATGWGSNTASAITDFTDMAVVATFLNTDDGVTTSGTAGKVDYFIINDADDTDAAYVYKLTDDGDATTSVEAAELSLIANVAVSTAADVTVTEVLIA